MAEAPSTHQTRTRMSAAARRESILDAARHAFITHGLHGSRTRDIAARAGVNEAMLYRHFASKEDLFHAAVIEPLQQTASRIADLASTPPVDDSTALDAMVLRTRQFTRDLLGVMQDVAPLLGAMVLDGEETAARNYREIILPVMSQAADVVRANLGWWEHREFDPDQQVRLMFGAVWFEILSARLEDRDLDMDQVAADLSTTVMLGLARRP